MEIARQSRGRLTIEKVLLHKSYYQLKFDKHIHSVPNIKYSLSSGQFNKRLWHIHWCLVTDPFSGTLVKAF